MHKREYIIKDGGLNLPLIDNNTIFMRVLLPGASEYTIINNATYDFISYEYIISPSTEYPASLNVINLKNSITVRRKSDGKILTGMSAGYNVTLSPNLYPNLKEV